LNLAINIQPSKAWTGTVYIKPDGSIDVPYVIYKEDKDNYPFMEPITINITTPSIPDITIPTITIPTSPLETSPTTTYVTTQPS
jgi:hypothetical protein